MTYATAHKTARMTTTRDRLNGGSIVILSAGSTALAAVPLNNPSGTVSADVLTFSGFPKTVAASATGAAASAKLRQSLPHLNEALSAKGLKVNAIRVKVRGR